MIRSSIWILVLSLSANAQPDWDVSLFRTINNAHTPTSDKFFNFMSHSMRPVVIAAPIGFVATGIIAKDRRSEDTGVLLAAATVTNTLLTVGMKKAVGRKRPYETLSNVHGGGEDQSASFPSGHTSSAFATATLVSLEYKKWYVAVPAYTWASLVGYSRIAKGVHYPSDVLMGAALGAGSAFLIWKLKKPILRFKDRIFR